jgi:DNA uptake protein ComE-like DNA-binding protein
VATKGERQALYFLAGVALLGAGARACRAHSVAAPSADLDRQIAAVESPAPHAKAARGKRQTRSARTDSAHVGDGIRSAAVLAVRRQAFAPPRQAVDMDVRTVKEIDALPGVGPSLARRLVANRDSVGAFGCLEALRAVKGVSRPLLRRLDSLVTFSGVPRPACGQR